MAGTVLTFQLTAAENASLKRACGLMGLRLREVTQEEYGKPLGALAGIAPFAGEAPWFAPLSDKMIVFAEVSNGQLDAILTMLRNKKIAPGAYKAVLTETNAEWTVPVLFAELQKERAALKK